MLLRRKLTHIQIAIDIDWLNLTNYKYNKPIINLGFKIINNFKVKIVNSNTVNIVDHILRKYASEILDWMTF